MPKFFRRPSKVQTPNTQTVAQPYKSYVIGQPRRGPALVTADTMLALPPFYASLRLLAGSVASLPVLDRKGDQIDVSPMSGGHLLAHPTAHDEQFTFIDSLMWNMGIHGNAFFVPTAVSPRDGRITEGEVIHPDYMLPRWNRAGTEASFAEGAYLNGETLGPSDFIHFKEATQGGYMWGISKLKVLAATLGLQASEIAHVKSTFDDGAQPTGYWKSDRPIDPDVAKKHAEEIAEAMGGRGNGVAVVGDMEWKQIMLSHADIQMLQSRQWSTSQAAQIVGVPPHLVGAATYDSETYSNARMDMAMFESTTVTRYKRIIEQAFQKHGIFFKFGDSELSQPTMLERVQAQTALVQAGIQSRAQAAENLGLQPPPEEEESDESEDDPDEEERLRLMMEAARQSQQEETTDA